MSGRLTSSRALVAVTALASVVGLALAATAPAEALHQATPSYQTNGRVTSIVTIGNTVYIGGTFTRVRPPGAAPATQEVARAHLAAFRLDNGNLRAWNPATNGTVSALAKSPDGKTLFVGGIFSKLNGQARHNVGAVSTKTGAVKKYKAGTNGQVMAIAVTNATVFLGGDFSRVKSKVRENLAATTRKGSVLKKWKPRASGVVRSLAISRDRTKVYAGGDFTAINRHRNQHLVALGVVKGLLAPWKSHPGFPVWDIVVKKGHVYAGGNGVGGRVQAYTTAGRRGWTIQADGGVQALTFAHRSIIVGGHFGHVCEGVSPGPTTGFNCPVNKATRSRLLALNARTGALKAWDPEANSTLGVFALAATKGAFFAGGDFTRVSGIQQQSFATFAKG